MLIRSIFLLCVLLELFIVDGKGETSFYSFQVMDIKGEYVDLNAYRGKITLVVNTASDCKLADRHFSALNHMQEVLGVGNAFTVLAFPSNEFGSHEPGTDDEVDEFINLLFEPKFPIMSKRQVSGKNASAEWIFLAEKSKAPSWNFHKYLIDAEGQVIDNWGGTTEMDKIFDKVKKAVQAIGGLVPKHLPREDL